MIILRITQNLMAFVGLQFKDSNPSWYKYYRVFCGIMLISFLQPMISHLMGILDDVIQATDVCIQISAEATTTSKAIVMICHWRTSKWLIDTMQNDFNSNEKADRTARFIRVDRECEFITKVNNCMLLSAGVTFTLLPLAILLINFIRGTIEPEMWTQPFQADFPFDNHSSPGYEFVYLLSIVYNVYVASFYGAIDSLYVGLCLYSIAYLEDFIDQINELNMDFLRNPVILELKNKSALTARINSLMRYHIKVLEFIDETFTLMTGIVFVQFFCALITLSTIAFQITLSEGGSVLIYVGPCAAVLVELFLFCYYGNKLTTRGIEVADAIYECNWYNLPVNYQLYTQLIMGRMQRPILMTGYGVVIADLATFAVVLKSVTSVIALFQSIQE